VPTRIWRFRFPDGHLEIRSFPEALVEGKEIRVYGADWVVGPLTDRNVTLVPKAALDGDVSVRVQGDVAGHTTDT
jgi:hypothetical protein